MPTGYTFEEIFTQHDLRGHPENARRLHAIIDYIVTRGISQRLTHVPSRPATREELTRCHDSRYVDIVAETATSGTGRLDADTYTNQYSYEAALNAAGGLIDLTGAVIKRELDNGFALVRPPGHHATPTRAMGFCLFGNIAIAARAARHDFGLNRIAIVDYDVHHGNGTQDILFDDGNILFVSSHQYPYYPGSGSIGEIGQGSGVGQTLNVPFPAFVGDAGFEQTYTEVVIPALRQFQPELIMISAGFDAHWADPLASLGLSLTGYHWLAQSFIALANEICGGRIVFVLEGGYNLEVLAPAVGNVFRLLLGDSECDDPLGQAAGPAEPDLTRLLTDLKRTHQL